MPHSPPRHPKKPQPKVVAAGAGGGLVAAVLALVDAIHISRPVAALIAAVVAFAAGYIKRN